MRCGAHNYHDREPVGTAPGLAPGGPARQIRVGIIDKIKYNVLFKLSSNYKLTAK